MTRRFLMNSIVALPIAAAVPVASPAMSSSPAAAAPADPVFALIEAHKATEAALAIACTEKSRLEGLGDWGADGGTEAAHDAEWSALANVVECAPATIAGVIASLTYICGLVEEGYGRIEDDLIAVLLANLAEALSGVTS
jgi:hypothetical protein